ncbi:Hypothetical predicted protein [Cloeon dipterum]|uniref:Methyltransferase domain-containing protein n=1 Tax=Cloeon dipterum TaxID=197152 RepID=A0A8S1BZB7_9INSE|nr:Hypothetical predicted protein [Cloeon dipterum]
MLARQRVFASKGSVCHATLARLMATKVKTVGLLDESLTVEASKDSFSGKIHPGRIANSVSDLPPPLLTAIEKVLADKNVSNLQTIGVKLAKQLQGRFDPAKATERRKWKKIEYSKSTCLSYMLSRMPAEYSAVDRAFTEISKWSPNFIPKTIFDFGSGVGSVPWAAISRWGKKLDEIFCIDSSPHMIELAELLLKGADANGQFFIPKTYFKQLMSPNPNRKFDLVVSAHTLFEFPTMDSRLDCYLNLWRKTNNYFVLVEQGTTEGFKLVDEAKEFLLFQSKKDGQEMHVLAPCPHTQACPRLLREGDRTPCNFQSRFTGFKNELSQSQRERFSFVILGKGPKKSAVPKWPRLVRHPLVRGGHVVCRLCTPEGKLEEVIFTRAKDGKGSYLCARSSEWGDLLPVKVREKEFVVRDTVARKDEQAEQSEEESDLKQASKNEL